MQEVFLAVERVIVRPRACRSVAAGDGLIAGEARLEHALAARQRRQPALEAVHPRGGHDRLDRREPALE